MPRFIERFELTHKDVFILGAGFSKAIHCSMPTTKELTGVVSKRIESSELTLPPPLKDPDDTGKELEENIELWMTYLSQGQPWLHETFNLYNLALANRIRRYIKEVINERTLRSMQQPRPEWLTSLIHEWSYRQATVLTLNYDTLVERAARRPLNTDMNADGNILPTHIYPPYLANIRSRAAALWGASELDTFKYFKLHGSVNWHYSGREEFYGETIYYSDVSPWGSKIHPQERNSLLSAGDKETLIIPPVVEKTTFFNNETVRRLWQEASDALEAATRVFVIGYSLPLSDLGMLFFLKRSLPIGKTTWYIVDRCSEVATRYQCLFEPQQTIRNDFVGKEAVPRFVAAYPHLPCGSAR